MRNAKWMLGAVLGLVPFLCLAGTGADSYEVAIQVTRDGKIIAAPGLEAGIGKPVEMRVTDETGNGYGLKLTIESVETRSGKATADLALEWSEAHDGEWLRRATPRLTATLGEPVEYALSGSGSANLSLQVRITSLPPKESAGRVQAAR